jgi:hypothetical protein
MQGCQVRLAAMLLRVQTCLCGRRLVLEWLLFGLEQLMAALPKVRAAGCGVLLRRVQTCVCGRGLVLRWLSTHRAGAACFIISMAAWHTKYSVLRNSRKRKTLHMRPFLQGLGLFKGRPVLSSMLNPILPGVCGGVCRMNTPCNPSIYLSHCTPQLLLVGHPHPWRASQHSVPQHRPGSTNPARDSAPSLPYALQLVPHTTS